MSGALSYDLFMVSFSLLVAPGYLHHVAQKEEKGDSLLFRLRS
jgi:hypothetical protein